MTRILSMKVGVDSIAYRTDLLFPSFDGEVLQRRGYVAVLTPSNPGFYWGNFLLFPRPPRPGDLARWMRLFELELGQHSLVRHHSFGWDTVDGDVGDAQPFVEAGFKLVNEPVMAIDKARPAPRPADIEVRPFESAADWDAGNALNIASDPLDGKCDAYADFKLELHARYRRMVEGSLGVWLGAFAGDELIGSLGLFAAGDVARFQAIETHPDHRGRGVATTLVAAACRYGLEHLAPRLVLVAAEGTTAHRIYQRLGFTEIERQCGVCRAPVGD